MSQEIPADAAIRLQKENESKSRQKLLDAVQLSCDLDMPEELHPTTRKLVLDFASALSHKLRSSELKYGYEAYWADGSWVDNGECGEALLHHLSKGDPRDVAAYCAFLWFHGASTPSPSALSNKELTQLRSQLAELQQECKRKDEALREISTEPCDHFSTGNCFDAHFSSDALCASCRAKSALSKTKE